MSFTVQEITDYAAFARSLATAARGQTLPRFRAGTNMTDKTSAHPDQEYDPVTDADREAERVQRELIVAQYPDHGIIGEEHGVRDAQGPWCWVLDPVDGTRAFVCGATSWVTLIALEHDGHPVMGLIDQPYTDELWVGANDKTVFTHQGVERDCRTSATTELKDARIATTDPRPSAYFGTAEADAFERLASQTRIARFSMDAYAYGLLAIGEVDLVVEAGLQHHDYAALVPVVEGAGGVITNWSGARVGTDDRGQTLAAATPQLHAAALAILMQA